MTSKKRKQAPQLETESAQQTALQRLRPLLGEADYAALLDELQRPLRQAIRINPLKVEPGSALSTWKGRYHWQIEPVPYCPTGFWVESAGESLSKPPEHRLGQYYIQDSASMLPVELFDLEPAEDALTLDMAASPGGKTTHLISRLNDAGLVVANDSSQDRISALRIVLQNWGGTNTLVTCFPGEKFGAWFPETFDRVLLDAPCSMQNLRPTDSHPMRRITPRERNSLAERQARLLGSALAALKTGGEVVYSTCTLSPEEDEGVLDAVLKRFAGCVEVKDVTAHLPHPAPGVLAFEENQYDPQVKNAVRMWPHRFGTSGFFAALLVKTAPVSLPVAAPPSRPLDRVGLYQHSTKEENALDTRLEETYGFNWAAFRQDHHLVSMQRVDSVYAIPEIYLQRFSDLPFQAVGMLVGEFGPNGFTPSHDWVARFGLVFSRGRVVIPAAEVENWLTGKDLSLEFQEIPASLTVAVFDDENRLLGRGKVTPGKLKNLLPRRLV